MNQFITFDWVLVTFFFVVCIACFVQIFMKRDRTTALVYSGLIVILIVTIGRIVSFRFIMAGNQVTELYLWISLLIGFALILIDLVFKLIESTKSNIKEIIEIVDDIRR